MILRLMKNPLFPDQIDPWRLAFEGGRLEGVLALAALPRLAAALTDTKGMVTVILQAGIDSHDRPHITGCLQTEVVMECQRCLAPLTWPLNVTVHLGLAHSEAEANRLPDEYEPLLAAEGLISVADLVEDELLLALPQIPLHADRRQCVATDFRAPSSERADHAKRVQPFAALASLLQDAQRSH